MSARVVLWSCDVVLLYSRTVEVLRCVILRRSTVLYLWGGGRHAPVLLQRQLDVQQTPRIQLNTQLLRTAGWQTGR